MPAAPPDSNVKPLQEFQAWLEGPVPEPAHFQPLLRALERAGLLEVALRQLKRRFPASATPKGQGWGAVRARMEIAVARSLTQRQAQWQMDPHRRFLRLAYEVRDPATGLNPAVLGNALVQAFLMAGVPLAMGLEKHPRPILRLGHPLPLGVEGYQEWADVGLRAPLSIPLDTLPGILEHHLAPGLRVLFLEEIPTISTPVLELCHRALWRWSCPENLRGSAQARTSTFLAAERFEIEKPGKLGGQKVVKRLNVRPQVLAMTWSEGLLDLETRLDAGSALNPIKLLGGVLGLEPTVIQGLVRVRVDLLPDPKLATRYRFETKLHNLYEDAVLLEADGGPEPVDDADDEAPLQLNR